MLRRSFVMIALAVMCTIFIQGVFVNFHQGIHVAREISPDTSSSQNSAQIEVLACDFCTALHQTTDRLVFGVSLSVPLPVAVSSDVPPALDPKSEIARTCDARGPPAYS